MFKITLSVILLISIYCGYRIARRLHNQSWKDTTYQLSLCTKFCYTIAAIVVQCSTLLGMLFAIDASAYHLDASPGTVYGLSGWCHWTILVALAITQGLTASAVWLIAFARSSYSLADELNIDDCAIAIREAELDTKSEISGPHEIAYGFGWNPSISYWVNRRRVHICADNGVFSLGWTPNLNLLVELSDLDVEEESHAHGVANDYSTVVRIIDEFLVQGKPISSIQDMDWIHDEDLMDPSIPDPPNCRNVANMCEWHRSKHFVDGGPASSVEMQSVGHNSCSAVAQIVFHASSKGDNDLSENEKREGW